MSRLEEIKNEIKALTQEAMDIVRKEGREIQVERARGYWYAHLVGALDKNHSFLGGSMFTMQDTIDDLDEDEDFDDEDEEEN